MQFVVYVNNWYSLQYIAKKMLLKNIIDGTRNISEGCNLLWANFNHSLRKGGGANLKMAENNLIGQMYYPNGMG